MKVYVESILDCPPDLVWAEVQTTRLLAEVIRPLLRFTPPAGTEFPRRWKTGQGIVGQACALGFLPLGSHSLVVEQVDAERRQIRFRERDYWVQVWNHLITVRATADGRTHYSDEIEIDAGLLTPLVGLLAQGFYRHRHRNWRRIARRLAAA